MYSCQCDRVVDFSKKYLPTLHQGAWDHERATIIIDDGTKFVQESEEKFDIIIIDSTDPEEEGPSAVLYKQPFYGHCKERLTEGGIMVTQNGHPNFEKYPQKALARLAESFKYTTVYQVSPALAKITMTACFMPFVNRTVACYPVVLCTDLHGRYPVVRMGIR